MPNKNWQKIKKSFVKPHALHPFLHGTSKTRVPDPLLSSGVPGNDSDHVKIDDRIDYLQNCGNDGLRLDMYIFLSQVHGRPRSCHFLKKL